MLCTMQLQGWHYIFVVFLFDGVCHVHGQTTSAGIRLHPTNCRLTRSGLEYAGPLNVTLSGRTCQPWSSDIPHLNYYTRATEFPERSARAAGNRCRNPEVGFDEGVWCYTMDQNKRWEHCNVSFCECKVSTDVRGTQYLGRFSTTRTGKTCQRWAIQSPQRHSFTQSRFFPERSVADAQNFCRNPNASQPDGPWCFTTNPSTRWEYCFVPVCNLTSVDVMTSPISRPTTPASTKQSTTTSRRPSSIQSTTSSRPPSSIQSTTASRPPSSIQSTTTIILSTTKSSTLPPLEPTPSETPQTSTSESWEGYSSAHETGILVAKILVPILIILALVAVATVILCRRKSILCDSAWERLRGWTNIEHTQTTTAKTVEAKKSSSVSVKKEIEPGFDNPIYGSQKDQQPGGYPVVGTTEGESSTDYEDMPPVNMISGNAVVYNIPLGRGNSM